MAKIERLDTTILCLRQSALAKIPTSKRSDELEWLGFVSTFTGGRVGDFCEVGRGGRTHVQVEPVEFFARLLILRPDGFFLFHNHPSQCLWPSCEDLILTRKARRASEAIGLRFFGHAIVTRLDQHWIPMGHLG